MIERHRLELGAPEIGHCLGPRVAALGRPLKILEFALDVSGLHAIRDGYRPEWPGQDTGQRTTRCRDLDRIGGRIGEGDPAIRKYTGSEAPFELSVTAEHRERTPSRVVDGDSPIAQYGEPEHGRTRSGELAGTFTFLASLTNQTAAEVDHGDPGRLGIQDIQIACGIERDRRHPAEGVPIT